MPKSEKLAMPEAAPTKRVKSGAVSRKIPVKDYRSEIIECEKKSWKFTQLLNPDMLQGKFVEFFDPYMKQTAQACVESVRWIERGIVKKDGKLQESIRPVRVKPSDLLSIEKDAKAKLPKKLREADWFSLGMDQPGQASRAGVYLPNPPGPYTKQLYLQQRWEMLEKCFEARNHDPILHGAVATLTAFVIGEGVDFKSKDQRPEVQAFWDEFEDRVELQRRLPVWSDMLSTDGNLFLRKRAVIESPGLTDLVSLDSGTIWEIITDPEDLRKKFAYWQQYSSPYLIQSVDGVPFVKYIINLIPADEVIHLKINCQEHEKFGRSDLFSALSTSMMLRDIMKFRAIRTMVESKLCVDHIIDGDEADIARHANASGTDLSCPEPIETWHSKAEEITFHQWQGSGTPKSGLRDEMVSEEAVAMGLPKEYIGAGDQASRATALTSTEPAAKLIKRRQTEFEYPLRQLYVSVIREGKKYGLLPADASEEVEITFPEIISENKTERIGNIVMAYTNKFISLETAATMVAKELGITSYDFNTENGKVVAEGVQRMATDPMLSQLYKAPTAPGLAPKSNDPYGGDTNGLSDKTRDNLKTEMNARESMAGSTMAALTRLQPKKPFNMTAARKEALMMGKSKFQLAEGDKSTPAGWDDVVKKLKKLPEIDNPYALVNWMDAQGYQP